MNLRKRINVFVLLFVLAMMLFVPTNVKAATVGQSLTNPEDGWLRYDNKNPSFYYQGEWLTVNDGSIAFYGGDMKYTLPSRNDGTIKFKFSGTKFRIIQQIYKSRSEKIQVKIDDKIVGYYSLYSPNLSTCQCLNYESPVLEDTIHYVELSNLDTSKIFTFDAIDIKSTGTLLAYDKVENLQATPSSNSITLTWNSVPNASKYNIKRSTTPGAPYEDVQIIDKSKYTVSDSSIIYTDKNLAQGNTYYYIVSAIVSESEGPNSNEVKATLILESDYQGNKAILEVVMTNGTIKEYDLSISELENFFTWYDNRIDGKGKSYFKMPKRSNVKPFISRSEYLLYDKIYSFEIKEYNE